MTALKKACGREFTNGVCDGRVERVTTHVGKCDACGAVWWVQRKSAHQNAHEEHFAAHSGSAVWVMNELLRSMRDLEDSLQRCFDRERHLETALGQRTPPPAA